MDGQNPKKAIHQGESITVRAKNEMLIGNIFLSSTSDDLLEYRKQVKEGLELAEIPCFLSENWVNYYEDTVEKCFRKIDEATGYIGIFAYWYGSIPPNKEQSITHLEFLRAKDKWNESENCRIAVLMPENLSDAEKALREKALKIICDRQIEQEKHDERLKAFHAEVKNSWRPVTHFKNQHELSQQVLIVCLRWQGLGFMEAARRIVEVFENNSSAKMIADEKLGSLGREKQLGDLKKILNRVPDFPNVPAIAFIISGNKDAGQYEFLQHLIREKKLKGRPPKIGRPQVEQYDLGVLIQWAGESLGVLLDGKEVNNLEELAALIYAELQNQNLCLILDEIHRYAGDVSKFYETFWTPLYKELERLQIQKKAPNQLIVFIVDYTGKTDRWSLITREYSAGGALTQADYSKLFLLQLTNITREEILDWFEEMEVPAANRSYLANVALKDANDEIDGTPQQVFLKLRKENLWDE